MKIFHRYLFLLLSLFADIYSAQAAHQPESRFILFRNEPDAVEFDWCSIDWRHNGRFSMDTYPDLESLKPSIHPSLHRYKGPVWSKINFSKWITRSGIASDYELPTDNTVQAVAKPAIDRLLEVQSMSKPSLQEYCAWMTQQVDTLTSDIAAFQQKKVLAAYQKRVDFCLNEISEQETKLQKDHQSYQALKQDVVVTTKNLVLGASLITGGTVSLLSSFKCDKLSYVIGGLYTSYLWWQYHEYQECMKGLQEKQNQIERKLKDCEVVRTQLNSCQPKKDIVDLFAMLRCMSKFDFDGKIAKYRQQQELKLSRWRDDQEGCCHDELVRRQSVEKFEFDARQAVLALRRSEYETLMQLRFNHVSAQSVSRTADVEQPTANVIPAVVAAESGWKNLGKQWASSIIRKIKGPSS